jgi:hypothetical protein
MIVVMSWASRQHAKKTQPDQRDFTKLNKMCTEQGVFTAPQYNEFRKGHDARIKYGVIN